MMLRFASDIKSVLFVVVFTLSIFLLWNLSFPSQTVFVVAYLVFLFFYTSVSVMVHNHQHLPVWKADWANQLYDVWLSILYGFPIFAWIPTHNINHHKYINKLPDDTRTYRYSERNNLLTLITYPSISAYFQQKPIKEYLKSLRKKNKQKYFQAWLQIVCLIGWNVGALIINWKMALLLVIVPQQLCAFTVLAFNYIQHVHADEEDAFNNSRNFTSAFFNYFWFNNGFHTAHHHQASLHWSQLPQKHAQLAVSIKEELNEKSLAVFLIRTYVISLFVPKLKSKSLRLQRVAKSG